MADPKVSVTRADINFRDPEGSAVSLSDAVLPTVFATARQFDGLERVKFVMVFASRVAGVMAALFGTEETAQALEQLVKVIRTDLAEDTGRVH